VGRGGVGGGWGWGGGGLGGGGWASGGVGGVGVCLVVCTPVVAADPGAAGAMVWGYLGEAASIRSRVSLVRGRLHRVCVCVDTAQIFKIACPAKGKAVTLVDLVGSGETNMTRVGTQDFILQKEGLG